MNDTETQIETSARPAIRSTEWLADCWINTYNGGTERGWGQWPTCKAAIDAMKTYGVTKKYHATMPLSEWCEVG